MAWLRLTQGEDERRRNMPPSGYHPPVKPKLQPKPVKVPLAERMAKSWADLQRG